jgi:phosphopantothenoylcysteine decarboxylase / phosphopantothenate---cysteine ligase
MLSEKKILLGITGSIAAYKAASLVRLYIKAGASVRVVMSASAKEFITPLTLSTLSRNPVLSEFAANDTGQWNNHVELGCWADLMVIAPASASTIARMASGQCDNLLLATYLSARCPVFLAPAMDLDMYRHPSTQRNLQTLSGFGNHIIYPHSGELASGLYGEGRMAEPEEIIETTRSFFREKPLKGKKALVTAGPTYENIDPVRFIGNYSSGKMGFSIAEELERQGAEVTLITGPTHISASGSIRTVRVVSAKQMHEAVLKEFSGCDIAVMAAAVADYMPADYSESKIKKGGSDDLNILRLKQTPDILADLGKRKKPSQLLIGFALETDNELANASGKLQRKNLDYIVLNSLREEGAGFGHSTNKITIIGKDTKARNFELKSKQEVAHDIVETCILNPNPNA